MGSTMLIVAGSPNPLPSFGGTSGSTEESRPPLVPIAIGVAAVLVVIGLFIVFSRTGRSQNAVPSTPDAYAASLKISDVAMSTANNFAGQQVTYLEGKIANSGGKNVTAALVQIIFHDALGQVAQKETQRLMVITTREPYVDTAPLNTSPLKSGQTKEFRLTFEHVSADWNMQVPEIAIVKTSTE